MSYLVTLISVYPIHDSPTILLVRSGQYHKHREALQQWYHQQHDNWNTIDGERSQWWVWNEIRCKALHTAVQIQQYIDRTRVGKTTAYTVQ